MKTTLHDNYGILNGLITAYKYDKKAIQERSENGRNTHESFLSCSVNKFVGLSPKIYEKIIRAASQLFNITSENEKHYGAVKTVFSSHSGKNSLLDGVSGPLETSQRYILSIDPGINGAIAIIKVDLTPIFVTVFDMPTYTLKVADKKRKKLDLSALSLLLETYSTSRTIALIEDVASMPSDGHVGAFSFGFSTGAIHGALSMAGIKIEKVKPAVWKAELGLDADKSKSIKLAIKKFPDAEKFLKRKMDDGRAEAILLGWYAWTKLKVKA
jgi:hypothetical protein